MNVVVCLKHVPDTTELRFSPATGELGLRGVATKVSDYDRHAVEAAARLQEAAGASVTLVCVGPADASRTLKEALASGAAQALLVADPAAGSLEPAATARILAAAVRHAGPADLVLCGDVSEDGYNGLVPGMLAALLGVPHVGAAQELSIADGWATVTRTADEVRETHRVPLPAVVSVSRTINQPRPVTSLQVMKVPMSRIRSVGLAELGPEAVAAAGRPATRVTGLRPAAVERQGRLLRGEPDQVVEELVNALSGQGVLA